MAMISPSCRVGTKDKYFNADSDAEAIEEAKKIPQFGQYLVGVYRVEGKEGIRIWHYETDK